MSNIGKVAITNEVISMIASTAVMQIEGVYSLNENVGDNLWNFKGINIDMESKAIDINIIMKHGFKVQEVAKQIQDNVEKNIEEMLGIKVETINVYVDKIILEEVTK